MNSKLLVLTLVVFGVSAVASARVSPPNKRVIEITHNDLFAKRGWDSRSVSIFGIRLGMKRAEVKTLTLARGLVMRCYSKTGNERSTGSGCGLFFPPNLYTTVVLTFNAADRVSEMGINRVAFQDARRSPEMSCLGLRGDTRQLVTQYTNVLRKKLLGDADVAKRKDQPYSGPEFTYCYRKIGLLLRVAALPEMTGKVGPPKYTRRELDELIFFPPRPEARSSHGPR